MESEMCVQVLYWEVVVCLIRISTISLFAMFVVVAESRAALT